MPVQPVKVFLLTIPKDRVESCLRSLVFNDLEFEVLSPVELGNEWKNVRFLSTTKESFTKYLPILERLLARFQPKGFLNNLTDNRITANFKEVMQMEFELLEVLPIAMSLDEYYQLQELAQKLKNLVSTSKLPITNLFIGQNLDQFNQDLSDFVKTNLETFQKRLTDQFAMSIETPNCQLLTIAEYQVLVVQPKDKDIVTTFLQTTDYGERVRPLIEFMQTLQEKLANLKMELTNKHFCCPDELELSSGFLKYLALTHEYLHLENLVTQVQRQVFEVTENSKVGFLFIALPAAQEVKLKNLIQKQDQVLVQETSWPVEMVNWKNPGDLASFQTIPQAMGTISQKETDPTLITAILFSLFFAFCLSDALYGLIIALITGFILFFNKPKPQLKNILTIFFWSGIVTVIYGALTNSWAGNLFQKTPIGSVLTNLQILDPLSLNPMQTNPELGLNKNPLLNQWLIEAGNIHPIAALLGFSLVIGLISLFTGYLIKMNNARKSKDWASLVFDISWIGFLVTLFVYIYSLVSAQFSSTITLIVMSIFTVALFVFNEGKNLVSKIVKGLGSLYGLISFGSDVLSFTRLVAVGLTSGIIANVINQLGWLLYQSISNQVLAWILLISFLILGHLFNLVIALFGAYINPLRLNYVEFYPKFFKGTARQIQPLQKNFLYLNLVNIN